MTQEAGRRFVIVDAMRGLAALSVAWFHLTNQYPTGWANVSGQYGWLGVEVFFVISGFIIPYSISLTEPGLRNASTFLVKRMVRLEPPFVASVLLVVILWYASSLAPGFRGSAPQISSLQVASHLLYLVPLTPYDWLQPVYWTLAYEFVFYLCVALMFPLVGAKTQASSWLLFSAAICAASLAGLIPGLALLFVIGVSAYRRVVLGESWILAGVAMGSAAASMTLLGLLLPALVGLAGALVIILGQNLRLSSTPIANALLGLGAISYSLYLVHVPIGGRVVNLGRRFVEGSLQEFALSLFALAVTLAAAIAFWKVIEKPSVAASRRLGAYRKRSLKLA